VQSCQHTVFNKGTADLDPAEQPPNARALHMENTPDHLDDIILEGIDDADAFGVSFSPSPFESKMEVTFPLDAAGNPGFEFAECDLMHRAFVSKVTLIMHGQGKGKETARRAASRKYNSAYIVEIEGQPVLSSKDIQKCLDVIVTALEPPQSIRVLLAPERCSGPLQGSLLHLRIANLCCVCAIINTDPSDTRQASYSEFISHYLETVLIPRETLIVLDDWLPEEYKDPLVSQLEASGMTDEEKGLKSFKRRTLKKLPLRSWRIGTSGMQHSTHSSISIMNRVHSWHQYCAPWSVQVMVHPRSCGLSGRTSSSLMVGANTGRAWMD
jgi:hypothetical protein